MPKRFKKKEGLSSCVTNTVIKPKINTAADHKKIIFLIRAVALVRIKSNEKFKIPYEKQKESTAPKTHSPPLLEIC